MENPEHLSPDFIQGRNGHSVMDNDRDTNALHLSLCYSLMKPIIMWQI